MYITLVFLMLFSLNNKPEYPKLKGMDCFRGKSLHSHDYRQPEPYHDETVLVIGGGPSAMDVTYHVANVARKVNLMV